MSSKHQRVWLIAAKVKVVGGNPVGLTVGSVASVQCFIPQTRLEVALEDCDGLLEAKGMRRFDVLACSSFEGWDEEAEAPDFVKRDVLRARESGKAVIGTFFTSKDSASFESDERIQ